MARTRRRRQSPSAGGPYVSTAVFCERILQDKDGVPSFIRVVDRLTITLPEGQTAPGVQLWAAITLKAGIMRGTSTLTFRGQKPSGETMPDVNVQVLFEGEDRGVGLHFQFGLAQLEEGLYWFEIRIDDVPLTKMPLRILFQQITMGSGPAAG